MTTINIIITFSSSLVNSQDVVAIFEGLSANINDEAIDGFCFESADEVASSISSSFINSCFSLLSPIESCLDRLIDGWRGVVFPDDFVGDSGDESDEVVCFTEADFDFMLSNLSRFASGADGSDAEGDVAECRRRSFSVLSVESFVVVADAAGLC